MAASCEPGRQSSPTGREPNVARFSVCHCRICSGGDLSYQMNILRAGINGIWTYILTWGYVLGGEITGRDCAFDFSGMPRALIATASQSGVLTRPAVEQVARQHAMHSPSIPRSYPKWENTVWKMPSFGYIANPQLCASSHGLMSKSSIISVAGRDVRAGEAWCRRTILRSGPADANQVFAVRRGSCQCYHGVSR
jgi:hypothetical protein